MVKILVRRPERPQTMIVVTSSGRKYSMDSTPPRFSYDGAAVFGTVEREGRKPITRMTAPGLQSLSFTHTVASLDWTVDIERVARRFTNLAKEGEKVRFTGGSPTFESPCWWQIQKCGVNVIQRGTNNLPSRVELSWELTEAVDVTVNISKPPPRKPKPPVKRPQPAKDNAYRTYTIRSGDTLWAISLRFLGNATKWRTIWNMNRNRLRSGSPHLIYPGEKIRIPRR